MVPWWKRLVYSLVSLIAAVIVTCGYSGFQEIIAIPNVHSNAVGLLAFVCYTFLFSLPGWLLALPIVLVATDIQGWRFWMYFAIGSCIGPVMILGVSLYYFLTSTSFAGFAQDSFMCVYLASSISIMTALIYLLLLQRAQQRSSQKKTKSDLPLC